ncbi:MAG: hypothetical protein HY903_09835 [Deltaproteobacteria bacterium]|nr:hypothetical protein [Deltaproteobacteria bacterium]
MTRAGRSEHLCHAGMVTAAVGAAYLITPYRLLYSDHHLMVPFLEKYADPGRFANDPTMDLYRQYSVLAFYLERPFVQLLGLEAGYLLLHFVGLAALFAAIAAISWQLYRRSSAVLVSLLIAVVPKYVMGSVYTFDQIVTSRHLAYPLFGWALWAAQGGRVILAALLCGVGFDVHPVTGIWAGLACLLVVVPQRAAIGRRRFLSAAVVGGVTVLPGLAARATAPGEGTLRAVSGAWLALVRLTNSWHFFFSSYDAGFVAANLALAVVLYMGAREVARREARVGLYLVAAALPGAVLFNVAFTEVWPVQAIMLASPMRLAYLVAILAAAVAGGALLRWWEERPALRWLAVAVAVSFALDYRIQYFPTFVGAWVFVALVVPRAAAGLRRPLEWALALVFFLLATRSLLRHGFGPEPRLVNNALIGAVSAVAIATCAWSRRPLAARLLPVTLALVLAVKAALVVGGGGGVVDADLPGFRHADPLSAAGAWARAATPQSALFLADPGLDFRAFSGRGQVISGRDGTYTNLAEGYALLWAARMAMVCRNGGPLASRGCDFDRHDEASFTAIAAATGATHLLVRREVRLGFLELFANDGFRVYRLPGS